MRLCVIGDPVGHSLSPRIHRRFMERCGAAGSYEAVTVTAETLEDLVVQGRRGAWDGCNVTMPLKERILPLLDAVEPWTASCGAVNTVCFRNGRAVGYNTDGPGVVESLRLRGFAPAGQAALVLGAGGAAKAAALALAQAGCRVTVCARTPEKAAALAARCGGVTASWGDLPRAAAEHGLLLNATPLGMEGSPEFESLDFVQALPAKAVVYDLVYHPTDTALLRAAEHRGLTAVGGLALLVQQAALAFAYDMPLILLLVGFVYLCETLSDIIQVAYFKATHGKRIFKMAPLHHHFEMCGWNEKKIVAVFTAVSALMCLLAYWGVADRFSL